MSYSDPQRSPDGWSRQRGPEYTQPPNYPTSGYGQGGYGGQDGYGYQQSGYPNPGQAQPQQQAGYGYQNPGYAQPYQQQPGYELQPTDQFAPHYAAPQAYGGYGYPIAVQPKSKLAVVLLALFFGYFGVHNFYVGNTNIGVAQLVTFVLSTLLSVVLIGLFGFIALGVWVLADIIMALSGASYMATDSNGIPLN